MCSAFDEAGDGQEVADRGGDVGLGLAFVVAAQNFGGGLLVPGIVCVDVHRTFGHLSRIGGRLGVDGVRGQQYWLTIMVAHSLWLVGRGWRVSL